MNFTENLITALKNKGEQRGKPLSDSSIKLYIRNLEKLNNDAPLKNLTFLKNSDLVEKKLEDYKPNTRRSYFISIVSCLATEPTLKKLYDKYFKLMTNLSSVIRETPTEEMNEQQKTNWIEWDEVIKIYDDLKKKVDELPKKLKSEKQFNTLLDYVILSLYVLVPPRRNIDYQKMMITKNINDNREDTNILDLSKKQFIFNVYKTVKKHGQAIVNIPNELIDVIELYVKHHPLIKGKKYEVPFLVNFAGEPLENINSITYILNRIFKKKVGSSMLRHIYLSGKYGDKFKEQQQDAELMGHSLSMAQDYIKVK
jgi:integrase